MGKDNLATIYLLLPKERRNARKVGNASKTIKKEHRWDGGSKGRVRSSAEEERRQRLSEAVHPSPSEGRETGRRYRGEECLITQAKKLGSSHS